MLGASLDQNGGIATVEKLTLKHAPSEVNIQHITTHDEGSGFHRVKVFLKGLLLLVWTLLSGNTDIVHIHLSDGGSAVRKAFVAKIALMFRKPVIMHAHGAEFDKKYSKFSPRMQQILSGIFRQCDSFIVLSKTWKDYYAENLGLDEKRITILPNPTELPFVVPNRNNTSKVKFGFFGRVGARKGTFDLIEAYASLPEHLKQKSELIIAGDGELEDAKNLVDILHLQENVTFLGWIDAKTRDTLLATIDVFVLPSYNEGLPMALLEAMGWGLPVIVTPVGGIPELVISGQNGLMVLPGDVEMLSKTIQQLIEYENYRLSLGQAARLSVAPFDVSNYSNSLSRIYTALLKPNSTMKVNICGIEIDKYDFNQVVERITIHALSKGAPGYVVTPNAQHILTLQKDAFFREIYNKAFLVVPDGVSLLWSAKYLKTPLNGRVNGTDLFEKLCAVAQQRGLKVFLLGGRPGAADQASQTLQQRHPGLDIVGTYCPPYGFESQPEELERINQQIKAAAPDILFVGLGAPKQEYWIYNNYQKIGVPISVGIGVSFELVANMVQRAPRWMQKWGLEWLFRLIVEPGRLWKRYIVGNPQFIWLILMQRLGIYGTKPFPNKIVRELSTN